MQAASLSKVAAPSAAVRARRAPDRSSFRAPVGNQAVLRRLQAKLTVGAVDDPLEAEADKVAGMAMGEGAPGAGLATAPPVVSRKCAACEDEDKPLRAKSAGGDLAGSEAPASVGQALAGPSRALDPGLRARFEPRLAADLSRVRVHDDAAAARSASELGALAYTVGQDIVFAPGAYAPAAPSGQRLIAHELAHVLQQEGGAVRRQVPGAGGAPDAGTGPTDGGAVPTNPGPTDGGAGGGAADPDYSCNPPAPSCPATYCQDVGKQAAEADRASRGEDILSDIRHLSSSAEPLFRRFVFTPGPAGDISSGHADEFAHATETLTTAEALKREILAQLTAHPPASIPPGAAGTIGLNQVLTPRSVTQFMECHLVFTDYLSTPGLIAGGVGKTQESDKRGKNTDGAINDARGATGNLMVSRGADGSFDVVPNLTFHVVDTLDFCPGNCGGSLAQRLTIPLSQWEASGISGDVPFEVHFPAPQLVGAYDDSE